MLFRTLREVTTDLTDEQDIIHAYTHPFNLEKPSQIRMKYIHSLNITIYLLIRITVSTMA